MRQVSVSITDETKARLEEIAKEKERSVSWVLRDMIQQYLDSKYVECQNKNN